VPIVTRGFHGRRETGEKLPPGQYLTRDFPVLSAGPAPRITLDRSRFTVTDERGGRHEWTWPQLMDLPSDEPTVDIHCVTKSSKFGTRGQASRWTRCSHRCRPPQAIRWCIRTAATPPTCPWPTCSAARPGWRTVSTASRSSRSTAARPGCWCRTCISGSQQSGCPASITMTEEQPGFCESLGYHIYGDPGAKSATWTTDHGGRSRDARRDLLEPDDRVRHVRLAGAPPGQHVDMLLTAEDGYSTQRSYSIATPADGVETYVCGPIGFVEAVVGKLALSRLDPAHIRTERFG
jgi:hypothetical protein